MFSLVEGRSHFECLKEVEKHICIVDSSVCDGYPVTRWKEKVAHQPIRFFYEQASVMLSQVLIECSAVLRVILSQNLR